MSQTAPEATGARTRTPVPAVASLRVDPERLQRLWALDPAERLATARRGQFTLGEMLRWASRRPQEVPLVAGEFFFIAALSADSECRERMKMDKIEDRRTLRGHSTG